MNRNTEVHWKQISEQIDAAKLRLTPREYKSLLESLEARAERELDDMDESSSNEDEIKT